MHQPCWQIAFVHRGKPDGHGSSPLDIDCRRACNPGRIDQHRAHTSAAKRTHKPVAQPGIRPLAWRDKRCAFQLRNLYRFKRREGMAGGNQQIEALLPPGPDIEPLGRRHLNAKSGIEASGSQAFQQLIGPHFARVGFSARAGTFTWPQVHQLLGIFAGLIMAGYLIRTGSAEFGIGFWGMLAGTAALIVGAFMLANEPTGPRRLN